MLRRGLFSSNNSLDLLSAGPSLLDEAMSARDRDGFDTLPRIPIRPEAIPFAVSEEGELRGRRIRKLAMLTNRTVGAIRGSWRGS